MDCEPSESKVGEAESRRLACTKPGYALCAYKLSAHKCYIPANINLYLKGACGVSTSVGNGHRSLKVVVILAAGWSIIPGYNKVSIG